MKKRILVICTGNSIRSQMAEAFLKSLSKNAIEAYSAGTHPSLVHPLAIKVMKESGIDISGNRSKSVNEFIDEQFDYSITVCDHARMRCPVFYGSGKRLHMPFDDPAVRYADEEEQLNNFRRVRDQIRAGMEYFLEKELNINV